MRPFGAVRTGLFLQGKEGICMETKIALIGIIVENPDSAPKTNELLHAYSDYIVGRMGIPYRHKGISIISITLDAPENIISSLSGKLGQISGISVKSMIAKTPK